MPERVGRQTTVSREHVREPSHPAPVVTVVGVVDNVVGVIMLYTEMAEVARSKTPCPQSLHRGPIQGNQRLASYTTC